MARESDPLLQKSEEVIVINGSPLKNGSIKKTLGDFVPIPLPWYQKVWKRDRLMIFIILAVLIGFLVGLTCNKPIQKLSEPDKSTTLTLLGFPGELLMRMLKMLILPLIVSSLIVGLADLDHKSSGRLGRRAILYYLSTTVLAVILGIILVVAIRPGRNAPTAEVSADSKKEVRAMDSFLDLFRNMFPDNLIKACVAQATTGIEHLRVNFQNHTVNLANITVNEALRLDKLYGLKTIIENGTNVTYYTTWKDVKISGETLDKDGTNVLGLVVFSILVGVLLGQMGDKAQGFIDWVGILNDVIMSIVSIVMWYSPVGIFSLIAAKFASMANIQGVFEDLALYMVTVIVGLIIHSCIVLPIIFFAVTRKNPLKFVFGVVQALLTAFGTSSSSATLPVTFRCLEENNGIDKRVTRFVLPVGATVNMDGTALYEAVAAIFIAQMTGLSLNFGQYVAVSITATLASIGAAGIPQAGLVTMLIVLQTIGLPEDSITYIIAVDWFLDRLRTTVNVLGDAFGAGIVDHLSKDDLLAVDSRNAHKRESSILEAQKFDSQL